MNYIVLLLPFKEPLFENARFLFEDENSYFQITDSVEKATDFTIERAKRIIESAPDSVLERYKLVLYPM